MNKINNEYNDDVNHILN